MFCWSQPWPILITTILTLFLIKEYKAISEGQKVVSDEETLLPIRIQEKNLVTQSTQYREFSFHPSLIRQLNLTMDQLQNGLVVVDGRSKHFVTSSGKRFPFEEKISSVATFITKTVKIDVAAMEGLTFDELKDDPKLTLDRMPPVKVTPLPEKCELFSLRMTSLSSSSAKAFVDDTKIFSYNSGIINKGMPLDVGNPEGLLLTVANAHTCQVTFHDLFQTTHFGGFRSLDLTLDSVMAGQFLIFNSLGEGSLLLNETTRTKLSCLGSQWSQLYAYRDRWVDVFVKGGRTLIEVIVPNLRNQNKVPSPLFTHLSSPANVHMVNCPHWPNTPEWEARRQFCETNEGYKSFCSCEDPMKFSETNLSQGYVLQFWSPYMQKDIAILELGQCRATKIIPELRNKSYEERLRQITLPLKENRAVQGQRTSLCAFYQLRKGLREKVARQRFDVEMDIPIVITASQKRSLNILRLLTTLSRSPGFKKELLLIAFDEFEENSAAIATILEIKTLKCRIEDTYGLTSRITQMIKCALFHQLVLFPWAHQVILLEDDIVISDDFYQFMQQMIPIFSLDPSVWCVSGFNLFSHPHTSRDSSRLYRSVRHPIWGWMMPTAVLKELLPRWIPHELNRDWDLYLLNKHMNKGRVCIVPDVIRSLHGPSLGIHIDDSIITERNVHSRQLNTFRNVKLQPLQRLKKDIYLKEIEGLILTSTLLEIASTKNFIFPSLKNETYVVYFNKTSPDYDIKSSLVRKAFGVYDDVLYDIPDVIQFFYLNCTVLLIHHPSDYSRLMPQDYIFFTPSTEEIQLFFDDQDSALRKKEIPRKLHRGTDSNASDLEESLFA